MKKIQYFVFAAFAFLLTGCFDTTQEITLNKDGSGTINNINDMGKLIGFAKQMGGGAEMEKAGAQKIDSTFSLADRIDSIPNLTAEEKEVLKKGTLTIKMSMEDEVFKTNMNFPFKSLAEVQKLNNKFNGIVGKIMMESMKGKMGDAAGDQMGAGEMPKATSIDDYYNLSFSKGTITKVLNKEKYATASDDQYLNSLKQAAGMGLPLTSTFIINLPAPVKNAEGKGVVLSDDKKKVTVATNIDDFFDDPSKLEFKIEY